MDKKEFIFNLEYKAEGGSGFVEGLASTYGNIDNVNDLILKGAFAETLETRGDKILMLYEHDTRVKPAKIVELKDTDDGLFVKAVFLNTENGKQAREEAKAGLLSFSIGYSIKEANYNDDGLRIIKELELFEISLVGIPANEKAVVTGVKSGNSPKDVKEFEGFLKKEGKFSNTKAKQIASASAKAFKADEVTPREADSLHDSVTKAISTLESFKHEAAIDKAIQTLTNGVKQNGSETKHRQD